MSIKPTDFLDFAQECQNIASETNFRCAISRAYYAAYHQVLSQLENPPNLLPSPHKKLITYLKDNDEDNSLPSIYDKKVALALANMLGKLKKNRVKSDYFLDKNISKHEVKLAISEANKIISASNGLVIKRNKKTK